MYFGAYFMSFVLYVEKNHYEKNSTFSTEKVTRSFYAPCPNTKDSDDLRSVSCSTYLSTRVVKSNNF